MIVIRLARGGAKKKPYYSVRVADKRKARDGSFLEKVGFFNPMARGQEKRLNLKMDRIESWLANGAQPSERVQRLIRENSLGENAVAEKRNAKLNKKRAQKERATSAKKHEALQNERPAQDKE